MKIISGQPADSASAMPAMETNTFLDRFAQGQTWTRDQALRRLLLAGVDPFKRPLFRIAEALFPEDFAEDREWIAEIAETKTAGEVSGVIAAMHYRAKRTAPFLRYTLGVRVSGRNILKLSKKLEARARKRAPRPGGNQPSS